MEDAAGVEGLGSGVTVGLAGVVVVGVAVPECVPGDVVVDKLAEGAGLLQPADGVAAVRVGRPDAVEVA